MLLDKIDFATAAWTVPAARMKSGHGVPLSAPALATLHEMAEYRRRQSPFVVWAVR